MDYFSVDRRGIYQTGARVVLMENPPPDGSEIGAHIHEMFPAGYSRHGATYFRDPWQNPAPQDIQSGVLELMLEATRRAHYPDKPSRYQSMFACDSMEAAHRFRDTHGKPSDGIYTLEPQGRVHRGDMAVYAVQGTFAYMNLRLHLYWQGRTLEVPGHTPKWEYLLELPVMVGERVPE